jgi:hypothetical protein
MVSSQREASHRVRLVPKVPVVEESWAGHVVHLHRGGGGGLVVSNRLPLASKGSPDDRDGLNLVVDCRVSPRLERWTRGRSVCA